MSCFLILALHFPCVVRWAPRIVIHFISATWSILLNLTLRFLIGRGDTDGVILFKFEWFIAAGIDIDLTVVVVVGLVYVFAAGGWFGFGSVLMLEFRCSVTDGSTGEMFRLIVVLSARLLIRHWRIGGGTVHCSFDGVLAFNRYWRNCDGVLVLLRYWRSCDGVLRLIRYWRIKSLTCYPWICLAPTPLVEGPSSRAGIGGARAPNARWD